MRPGERFGAENAQRIGLVHEVLPANELSSAVDRRIAELRTAAPGATRAAKQLLQELRAMPADHQTTYLAERIAAVRTGEEGQEGLRAFLEKRAPVWRDA